MLEITIIRKERENRETGKKFPVYSAIKKDNTLIDCRFRQEIENIPTDDRFIIVVNEDDLNVDKRHIYPRLWVRSVQEFKPVVFKKSDEISEMF